MVVVGADFEVCIGLGIGVNFQYYMISDFTFYSETYSTNYL
jgi:hypothetical protein